VGPTPACRNSLAALAALAFAGCGWLPSDAPPAKPVPVDPDAAVLQTWKVTGHVLGPHALISDYDAAEFHGRIVPITPTSYNSPWSGACDDARRDKQPRTLAELVDRLQLPRDRVAALGLADPIVEYHLNCASGRAPTLVAFVAGDHAATCWGGVCYSLAH
jgi:hypothetical protein